MKKSVLREIYGYPRGRAKIKVLSALEKHSINFILHSPFLVLSSFDKNGKVDTSPRGGSPGFVKVLVDNKIVIPDSKGNNRVDSLGNIAETGRVGMLFLVPGIDETLRVNGAAFISSEKRYIDMFPDEQNPPKSVLIVEIEEVFLHCAKALMRSKLWDADRHIERSDFPTMGRMLNDQLKTSNPEETQDEMVKRYLPDL